MRLSIPRPVFLESALIYITQYDIGGYGGRDFAMLWLGPHCPSVKKGEGVGELSWNL